MLIWHYNSTESHQNCILVRKPRWRPRTKFFTAENCLQLHGGESSTMLKRWLRLGSSVSMLSIPTEFQLLGIKTWHLEEWSILSFTKVYMSNKILHSCSYLSLIIQYLVNGDLLIKYDYSLFLSMSILENPFSIRQFAIMTLEWSM